MTAPSTGRVDELELLDTEIHAADAEHAAEQPPPPPAEDDELEDTVAARAEELAEHPEKIDQLKDLDADDLADVAQLAFGLAADVRGPHWELPDKSAKRLGKWLKRVIDKHGLEWLKAWLPELVTALLIAFEIRKRVVEDHRLAEKKKQLEPPQEPVT